MSITVQNSATLLQTRFTEYVGTHLVLANGMGTKQEFLAAANFKYVTSDVHRHTFLLLLGRYVHRSNLSTDRLGDNVFRRCVEMHLHRDLAAFSCRCHDPQAD